MRDNLIYFNDDELYIRVKADEYLYSLRNNVTRLISELEFQFRFTQEQLNVLLADLVTEGIEE